METHMTVDLTTTLREEREAVVNVGQDINELDGDGQTQLLPQEHYQAQQSYKLLENSADINKSRKNDMTSLQEVLLSGSLEAVEVLLKIDSLRNKNKATEIERCQCIIEFLLKEKKNYNIKSSKYYTLLHFSAMLRDIQSFDSLLKVSNDFNINAINPNGFTLLHTVVVWGTPKMAYDLLVRGADVNLKFPDGFTPLLTAAKYNDTEKVSLLLHFDDLVIPYVQKNSDPLDLTIDTSFPFREYSRIEQFLFDPGTAEYPKSGSLKTPLQAACSKGHIEVVKLLLQHGANLNMKSSENETLLHYAARSNHLGLVKFFLKKGLDPNARNISGETPMFWALSKSEPDNSLSTLKLLVEYGANINTILKSKKRLIHITCSDVIYYKLTKYLLTLKAKINANSSGEISPLFLALDAELKEFRLQKSQPANFTTLKLLCMHNVILKNLGKYVSQQNLQFMRNYFVIRNIYEECELEISKMKEKKISSSNNLCYFELLKADAQKLTVFARNENIMKVLSFKKYKKMFPLSASFLTDFIEEGKMRRDLFETCADAIKQHLELNIPRMITDIIFNYLREKDLKNFKEAFQSYLVLKK